MSLDEVTEEILKKLILDRGFQELWSRNVAARLEEKQKGSSVLADFLEPQPSTSEEKRDPILISIDELTLSVNVSIETFLKSVDLALSHMEGEENRDASTIYATRMQVERLVSLPSLDSARLSQCCRKIVRLFSIFNRRISSPLQLANCSLFASSLCDILYQLEDWIATRYSIPREGPGSGLRRAINRFNKIVIDTLERMVQQARHQAEALRVPIQKVHFLTPPARKPDWSGNSRRPIQFGSPRRYPWEDGRKGGSWIMSRQLAEQKSRLSRSAPRLSNPRTPLRPPLAQRQQTPSGKTIASSTPPGVVRQRNDIEKKWRLLLDNQSIFAQSMLPNEEGEVAFRMAREITDEVMTELRRRKENYGCKS